MASKLFSKTWGTLMSGKPQNVKFESSLKAQIAGYTQSLPVKRVILAVSGGTDSLVMMHVCARWRLEWDVEFVVATLDHGLRGVASQKDCEQVLKLAKQWGLPCVTGSVDVKNFAESARLNLEEAARTLRYEFLLKCAKEHDARAIFTAHHLDDQVETVLTHILRGCGITGLGGIREQQVMHKDPTVLLIRPMLSFCRSQLTEYCEINDLHPSQDVTNTDLRYTRNRLRHCTIPLLRKYNPNLEAAIFRLATLASETEDFLRSQSISFLQECCALRKDSIKIPREKFLRQHRAMQMGILRYAIIGLEGGRKPYHAALVQARELAKRGSGEKVLTLTKAVRLRLAYEHLIIESKHAPILSNVPLIPAGCQIRLEFPGTQQIPESKWSLEIAQTTLDKDGHLHLPENSQVSLRTRRSGDRIIPLGMKGHSKTLKRWLIDQKVPRFLREQIPLLIVNGEIAAVYWQERWFIGKNYNPKKGDSARIFQLRWLDKLRYYKETNLP